MFQKNLKKYNDKLFSAGWKSQFMGGFMHPVMNFISNIGYVAVAVAGGYFAIKGRITVGNIQSLYNITSNLQDQLERQHK